MSALIDNDVFFAAIYAGHEHHPTARKWLDQQKERGWTLATETWLAAMRLLMNPAIMGSSQLKGREAWEIVHLETGGPYPAQFLFPKDPPSLKEVGKAEGHRQVMDFWLVQLVRQEQLKLATFDKALKKHWPSDVLLIQ